MAWEGEPVRHALGGSLGDPRARAISVPLGGHVGRFLQCRFLFAGPWLLFSEISFISGKPLSVPALALLRFACHLTVNPGVSWYSVTYEILKLRQNNQTPVLCRAFVLF
jgi:hypothetical protein